MASGAIRVGVGGWDFDPWRESFYPAGLARSRQLEYLGTRLSATEINATYYKLQSPHLFERWAKSVPEGFKFAVKASRFCTNRKRLGEGGEAIAKFCGQGLVALGDKLGPILWQLMATKQFDPKDFQAFLDLLPQSQDGIALRHVVEPRHPSFQCPQFVAMVRKAGVSIAFADAEDYPAIADVSGEIVYARLQRSRAEEPEGYDRQALALWAERARLWASGARPSGLSYCAEEAPHRPRETYVLFTSAAKVRNPAAASALIGLL